MNPTLFYVNTSRLHFHCRSWGEADGIPVLLLHGSYGTSRWWERFGDLLPEQIYAVAPDLRGCGLSDKPPAGYTVEEQAADVRALVEALAWDDFHLMAHSSSGAIAVEYGLAHRESVATLTLVDSVPVEGVFTPIDTYMLLEQMRSDRALLRRAIALLMPTVREESLLEQYMDDAQQMAASAFTATAQGLSSWNRFADARRLTLPVLMVWGELDTIVDRDATTRSLIAIPGANNLEILRGVGHSPMVEAPTTLLDRFIDFITQDFDDFDRIRRSI